MQSEEDNTSQQQQEEGDADTVGKKKRCGKSYSSFRLLDSSKKRKIAKLSASCINFNGNWKNSKWKQKTSLKTQTSQKPYVEENLERYIKDAPSNLRNFRVNFLIAGNSGWSIMNR